MRPWFAAQNAGSHFRVSRLQNVPELMPQDKPGLYKSTCPLPGTPKISAGQVEYLTVSKSSKSYKN